MGDRTRLTHRDRIRQMMRLRGQHAAELVEGRDTSDPVPDPVRSVPQTANFAVDSLAELRAIHTAMTVPPGRSADVRDSPHWLAAYWPSRQDKEAFLLASGLDILGDKYLDGNQAATILGLGL